jgi:hypothetical protein
MHRGQLLAAATLVAMLPGFAPAQCPSPGWLPGAGVPGIQGYSDPFGGVVGEIKTTTTWDPDGAGPLPTSIVVGGTFDYAGSVSAINIAAWDGSQWTALGSTMESDFFDGPVFALATLNDGRLLAGGFFSTAGGTPANNLAVWDGSAWSALGDGVDGIVSDIVVRANGHVIVTGGFLTAGGAVVARGIARWDGTDWFAIDQGLRAGTTGNDQGGGNGLALMANGDIMVAGSFNRAGPTLANCVARLSFAANGTTSTWFALGTGLGGTVSLDPIGQGLDVLPNGDVVVGGVFTSAGGVPANNIARWNGSAWSALAGGLGVPANFDGVVSIAHLSGGDLIAAGTFQTSGTSQIRGLARWTGTAWTSLGNLDPLHYSNYGASVYSLLPLPSNQLVAAGVLKGGAALWNGSTWSNYGTGFNHSINAVEHLPNGDVIVAGLFETAPGIAARHVARFDGSAWHALGAGLDFVPGSLLALPDSTLLAAGTFVPSGVGPVEHRVARWDGTAWSTVTTNFKAYDLALLPSGVVIAAGQQSLVGGVYTLAGSSWTILGGPFATGIGFGAPSTVGVLPNGHIVAGGNFETANGVFAPNVAEWDGTAWNAMGSGVGNPFNFDTVYSLTVLTNGDVIVAGQFPDDNNFTILNNVARWNGSAWVPVGTGFPGGLIFSLSSLPDNSIVAAGPIADAVSVWDGGGWGALGPTIQGGASVVHALPNGNIAMGGTFVFVGGSVSANFAIYGCPTPACPADVDDGSGTGTPDGGVTIDDLIYYLSLFELGDIGADLDDGSGTGTPDGGVTIDDLIFYLTHFEAGC